MLKDFFGLGGKKTTKKVMVVEDDALLSKVLSEALGKEGFEIATVNNGTDVMASAKRFLPQIIMLDLMLPGMDGFMVLKELKADDKLKNIPVVVLSNLDEAGDVKSTKALGADQYFIKANTEMAKIIDYVKKTVK